MKTLTVILAIILSIELIVIDCHAQDATISGAFSEDESRGFLEWVPFGRDLSGLQREQSGLPIQSAKPAIRAFPQSSAPLASVPHRNRTLMSHGNALPSQSSVTQSTASAAESSSNSVQNGELDRAFAAQRERALRNRVARPNDLDGLRNGQRGQDYRRQEELGQPIPTLLWAGAILVQMRLKEVDMRLSQFVDVIRNQYDLAFGEIGIPPPSFSELVEIIILGRNLMRGHRAEAFRDAAGSFVEKASGVDEFVANTIRSAGLQLKKWKDYLLYGPAAPFASEP